MDVDCRPAGKVQLGQRRPRKMQCRPSQPSTVNVDQIEKNVFLNSEIKIFFFMLTSGVDLDR